MRRLLNDDEGIQKAMSALFGETAMDHTAAIVEKYLPVRTSEAFQYLMEDMGMRKSDGGAIRTSLKVQVTED